MMLSSLWGRRVAWGAVYAERYGISLIFLGMAAHQLHALLAASPSVRADLGTAPITGLIRQLIWVQLYLYFGLLLLLGRRVATPPQRLPDVLLPLATTFFYLAYYAIPWLPVRLQHSGWPAAWQPVCVTVGVLLNLFGLWISMWAAVHLGRSFGVLIEVRTVVLEGAYRHIRHPMYAGYVFFLAGFALTNGSLACCLLVPLHIGLLLYRARLEEARLAACSPAYAEYRKRTGFIFPKFRQGDGQG